jgi:hypothetical protein
MQKLAITVLRQPLASARSFWNLGALAFYSVLYFALESITAADRTFFSST